jgi:cytoplasmic iron level regulating protein YaaA (DUF328/UPF0246 family)
MLLLPPSEGKAAGGSARSPWAPDGGAFGAALAEQRIRIAEALGAQGGGDERLLGVRGDHLVRAQSANGAVIGAPTLPAWQRYTGVVWDHLDPASLPAPARRRIVVVSGLLGLVRADDRVPDYRLKMGAALPPFGTLSTWWRAAVSAELARAARRRFVVDLLPHEHRAALAPDALTGLAGVRIALVDPSGRAGGHFAKAAKGELARAVLLEGIDVVDRWDHPQFEVVVTPF